MHKVVIVDALRTPMGKSRGGAFRHVRAETLSVAVIQALLARNPALDPREIEDVIWGCANQTLEQGVNVARTISLMADLPHQCAGQTINRLCGSSLQALISAAQAIYANQGEVFLCGGVEHMGHVAMDHGVDIPPGYSLFNARAGLSMGLTAELLATRYKISRQEQDAFALASHQKAARATREKGFQRELLPVRGHDPQGLPFWLDHDEVIRQDASAEGLAKLPPAFNPQNGSVTAGNASALSDGASAMLVMSAERAKALGLKPLGTLLGMGVSGLDPSVMGLGPVFALKKALGRARMKPTDLEILEVNEAFAAQVLAVLRELGQDEPDHEKLNLHGGAIALGHPLGCSGARIVTTLLHAMETHQRGAGLATMCIGMGQGIAAVFAREA